MLRDGPAAANRWLDEQAGAAPADARPRATTRTGKTSCKKVRWVNRATPGFGGGPMTMSRVAVCADEFARDAIRPDPARIKHLSEAAPRGDRGRLFRTAPCPPVGFLVRTSRLRAPRLLTHNHPLPPHHTH